MRNKGLIGNNEIKYTVQPGQAGALYGLQVVQDLVKTQGKGLN